MDLNEIDIWERQLDAVSVEEIAIRQEEEKNEEGKQQRGVKRQAGHQNTAAVKRFKRQLEYTQLNKK